MRDTYTPTVSVSVISDRLTASTAQQLNETLQPPPSHPIESENPPLANTHTHALTRSHAQSHADTMPIGTDLLIDLNSLYIKTEHQDRLLPVLATEHQDNRLPVIIAYLQIFHVFVILSCVIIIIVVFLA